MREIKFRAWYKKDKIMYYPTDPISLALKINGFLFDYVYQDAKRREFVQNNYELMQFTGLYDKNAKEIYEGDIVKCPGWKETYDRQESIKVEVIKEVNIPEIFSIWNEEWDSNTNEVKVIGNIYENSYLLSN